MLITLTVGGLRYGLDCNAAAAVVALADLKKDPADVRELEGILDYHGAAVPVLDLNRKIAGRPSTDQLSTRIVLVSVPGGVGRLAGLIAEQINETAAEIPGTERPGSLCLRGIALKGGPTPRDIDLKSFLSDI